jgi:hypothetical protein
LSKKLLASRPGCRHSASAGNTIRLIVVFIRKHWLALCSRTCGCLQARHGVVLRNRGGGTQLRPAFMGH